MNNVYILLLILGLLYVPFGACYTMDDATSLHVQLFHNSSYNRNVRGIVDQDEPVRVNANLSLLGLGQLMEREEAFQVNAVLYLQWQDERLMWNRSDYNGTSEIVVYQDAIWKPEVKLANSVFEVKPLGNDRTQIKIYNTGMVMWIIPDMYQATCSVDVVSFPWDRQSCSLNFLVSTYSSTEVTIQTASDTIHTQEFEDSESWRVMKTKSMTLTSQVQFWVCMERRPSFHISVVFMPIVFLSVLNIFVFLLAADSGERISFSITLLLSITLYLSMISDNLPSHSRGMSAIIYCLNFVLTESTVICVLSIISLNIYNKKGKPPPTLQSILKKLHRSRSRQVQDTDEAHAVSETIQDHKHEEKGDAGSSQHAECTRFTWHDVSNIVDRICICLASLALCLAFVIFYINTEVGKMECM